MTSEKQEGANKLVLRILDEAKADARMLADEAARAAEKLREEKQADAKQKYAEFERKRVSAVEAVMDGCRTRAAIEGTKAALQRKREIIDEVFSRAYAALLGLDAATRGAICRKLLMAEAESGESILPAKADREAVAAFVAAGKVRGLALEKGDAPYDGGFLLLGKGYEKDCSFASLVQELRDAEETAVARMLFN